MIGAVYSEGHARVSSCRVGRRHCWNTPSTSPHTTQLTRHTHTHTHSVPQEPRIASGVVSLGQESFAFVLKFVFIKREWSVDAFSPPFPWTALPRSCLLKQSNNETNASAIALERKLPTVTKDLQFFQSKVRRYETACDVFIVLTLILHYIIPVSSRIVIFLVSVTGNSIFTLLNASSKRAVSFLFMCHSNVGKRAAFVVSVFRIAAPTRS